MASEICMKMLLFLSKEPHFTKIMGEGELETAVGAVSLSKDKVERDLRIHMWILVREAELSPEK